LSQKRTKRKVLKFKVKEDKTMKEKKKRVIERIDFKENPELEIVIAIELEKEEFLMKKRKNLKPLSLLQIFHSVWMMMVLVKSSVTII